MKLEGIELVRVEIPFVHDIGTAAGVHRTRSMLFVRVATDDGEGWGECAALSEGTSVDPSVDVVEKAAKDRGVPRLIGASRARGGDLPSGAEVAPLFGNGRDDRQLAAAFEMAVWDAELRAADLSMAQALDIGPGFETMPVGAVVGIPADRDVDVVRRQADAAVSSGITPGADQDRTGLGRGAGRGDQGGSRGSPPPGGCERFVRHHSGRHRRA